MRMLACTLSLITFAFTAVAVQACLSDQKLGTDGSPTTECQADRLPTDGTACDTIKNPAGTFCRLGSCGSGGEVDCACVSGRWKCGFSYRDAYGCGTPPYCREMTSASCDTCVFREGGCLPPTAETTCCGQTGYAYDEARDCKYGVEQVIACAPGPLPSTAGACGMTGAVGCAITMEGGTRRVWFTPGRAAGWTETEKCSSELYERVTNAKLCIGDAGPDVDPPGDAACPYPITALGPWNVTKACWPSTEVFFECAAYVDGGTVFTCFVRISTGEFFLAPTTQIPSGSDYRACTAAESSSHGAYSRCE